MTDTEILTDEEILDSASMEQAIKNNNIIENYATVSVTPDPAKDGVDKPLVATYAQWAVGNNNQYSPVGATIEALPSGIYEAYAASSNWGLERLRLASDEIYELPDMATNAVLAEAERFWHNEDKYKKHNLLYKRGIILHGPPGSGKTVTIKLLIRKLIEANGIVLLVQNVPLANMALKAIKRIEPNRNLICVLEDIDEIISANGESIVLSLLDGEHNVDRVLNIATTNYPDMLGARIINRPSRFDNRVEIRMPSAEARAYYLKRATSESLTEPQLKQWVTDTEDMSIAHLRELVAAVYCLDQPYSEVIERLVDMAKKVKVEAEFKSRNSMGFAGAKSRNVVNFT